MRLSDEIGAEFIEGGFWRKEKVRARFREWTITLDTYTESQSEGYPDKRLFRIMAPYVDKDGFRFNIYRSTIFSKVGKIFGMQDIEVGYPEIDRDFIIKGNDESKVRALFANPRIRQLMQLRPWIKLIVKDKKTMVRSLSLDPRIPKGLGVLYFDVEDDIKDVTRLKSHYELFVEFLNQLSHIGSASPENPNFEF